MKDEEDQQPEEAAADDRRDRTIVDDLSRYGPTVPFTFLYSPPEPRPLILLNGEALPACWLQLHRWFASVFP